MPISRKILRRESYSPKRALRQIILFTLVLALILAFMYMNRVQDDPPPTDSLSGSGSGTAAPPAGFQLSAPDPLRPILAPGEEGE